MVGMGITFAGRETRTIGIGALIVAIGAGMTSNLLFLAALQFRVDWFLSQLGSSVAAPRPPSSCAGRRRWISLVTTWQQESWRTFSGAN